MIKAWFNCSIEELMSVPGIGAKVADKILELREAKGDLELDDLNWCMRVCTIF
jgi:DNA uptake protein ComE-like DNA-binding protein